MDHNPIWMSLAKAELGVHEIPGPPSEKRIVWYDSFTTLKATDDAVPWCSAFVNAMIHEARKQDPAIPEETKSAAAHSWRSWGRELESGCYGCVVVFDRPGGGHVGFYDHEDDDFVYVLGGNQGDKVCIAKFRWEGGALTITNFRWPEGWPEGE